TSAASCGAPPTLSPLCLFEAKSNNRVLENQCLASPHFPVFGHVRQNSSVPGGTPRSMKMGPAWRTCTRQPERVPHLAEMESPWRTLCDQPCMCCRMCLRSTQGTCRTRKTTGEDGGKEPRPPSHGYAF